MPHLLIFIILLLLAGAVAGQTPHDRWHERYQEWRTDTGASCCNAQDCRGAQGYRLTPDGYEVLIGEKFYRVPERAIRPYASPDGDAHVCYRPDWMDAQEGYVIICFIRPMGV